MKHAILATLAAFALASPALAGDPAKGETEFKKCKSCHAIVADDGTEIVKGGKTGPNLYGVVGRAVGSVADFKYGESIVEVGEKPERCGTRPAWWPTCADPAAWLKRRWAMTAPSRR
jgi:cytochrome c